MGKNKNLTIITVIFGIIILLIGILNHYFFRTYTLDYATYNFAWFDYSHFRISNCPVYFWTNDITFFQDHFSLTLIFLIPLYWLFSPIFGTYSLIIIQALFILFGGWGTYRLVKLKTNKELYSVFALILYYTTYGRWASFVMDVNLEIILASLLPVFLFYFESKKYIVATIVFLFMTLGRENIPLWFIFIGLYLLIEHWKDLKMRKITLFYIVFSGIYFILAFKVFIPLSQSSTHDYSLFNYAVLGANPFEAIKTIITNPEKTFTLLFVNHLDDIAYNNVKMEFYFVYLFSGMILLFFKPKYLLLFLPIIAQKMYNDNPVRWSIDLYYSVEIVTILPFSVFLALNEINISEFWHDKKINIKKMIGIMFILLSIIITIYKFDGGNRQLKWYSSKKDKFYSPAMYKSDFDVSKVHKDLKIIPDTAKVSASTNIAPHLAFRRYIYYFPKVEDANYIAVLENHKHYAFSELDYSEKINDYVFSNDWNEIVSDFPILIMKKELDTNNITKINCDLSSLTSDSSKFYDNQKKYTFSNANLLSHETSFDDDSLCVKLDDNNQFGLTLHLDNIVVGTNIRITIWQKGADAVLVASAKNTDDFYITSNKVVEQNGNWKKIQLDVIVKQELPDKTLMIYTWKNTDNDIKTYIDDLEILKY